METKSCENRSFTSKAATRWAIFLKKLDEFNNLMKKIIYFILLLISQPFFGQENVAKKPENVIIIKGEISSMEQVEKYGNEGYIKAMVKGVSDKERNELAKKFGNKIGEKEFIIKIELYTEKEKIEK